MAGVIRRIMAGAWLAGAVLAAPAAFAHPGAGSGDSALSAGAASARHPGPAPLIMAQAGRAWSDPPADLNAGPLVQDSGARSAAKPADSWPDEAARRRGRRTQAAQPSTPEPKEKATARAAEPADIREKPASRSAASRDSTAARSADADDATPATEARKAPRRSAASQRRQQETRAAAKPQATASAPQRRRSVAGRSDEGGRVRTARPGGYEVMRLRTLMYPDGRVVEVLTRPDQEIVDIPLR